MLWTIAVILLLLWAVGIVSSYTLGGFIHMLLGGGDHRGIDPRDPRAKPSRLAKDSLNEEGSTL